MSQGRASANAERRKSKRRPVLETFSVFIVIPKKGIHRLQVQDISENGIGFNLDEEGEVSTEFPIGAGDSIDLRFYINSSLFIPLSIQVIRVDSTHQGRRIGAEFQERKSR